MYSSNTTSSDQNSFLKTLHYVPTYALGFFVFHFTGRVAFAAAESAL